ETSVIYEITNNGETLNDCLLEITATGATGDKVIFCGYIENWDKKTTLYLHGSTSKRRVDDTKKIDVTLLSPNFSTAVSYLYTDIERGKAQAILFKDIELSGSYQEKKSGFLYSRQRSFTTKLGTIYGYDREILFPNCRYSVTFCKETTRKTWYLELPPKRVSPRQQESLVMKPKKDELTFDPDTVEVEISFPYSDYKIRKTFECRSDIGEKTAVEDTN
ncbi:MAG: hypothetical protein LBH59_07670, partial [Planctomycetaceae bacterium]|nr:hypothetical protein [Planctomycetaceae bacterium]